jgi:hypothetical protein
MGITLMKQSAVHVCGALIEGIEKWMQVDDKDEFCDPNEPLVIMINGKRHHVLSVGGDPDEKGFVLEVKPESYWIK